MRKYGIKYKDILYIKDKLMNENPDYSIKLGCKPELAFCIPKCEVLSIIFPSISYIIIYFVVLLALPSCKLSMMITEITTFYMYLLYDNIFVVLPNLIQQKYYMIVAPMALISFISFIICVFTYEYFMEILIINITNIVIFISLIFYLLFKFNVSISKYLNSFKIDNMWDEIIFISKNYYHEVVKMVKKTEREEKMLEKRKKLCILWFVICELIDENKIKVDVRR